MPSEFKITRRVEFSETDMAGVMHFSNYFRLMEYAEHAFVRSLGLTVMTRNTDPIIGWPRVAASCEYLRPLHFEDEVEIHLRVASRTEKAVRYEFTFRKNGDSADCARGSVTVVCCTIRGGKMQATFIPPEYATRIEIAEPGASNKRKPKGATK